jgi:transcriptional regulator with XRE-family HTH domain
MEDLALQLRQALKDKGFTQAQLAEMLETTQPVISRTLTASVLNDRSHWPAILDILGLEVVLQPKTQEN